MATERFYGDEQEIFVSPESFTPATPKIGQALETAKLAHEGQVRKTGEPFYYHPIAVAQILISWGLGDDEDLIAAALLHDVPEDNPNFSLEVIREQFGVGVARLVDGVTKVDSQTAIDIDRETLRKVSTRSYLEPKVALIKLADRLHNMRTLSAMSREKQIEKATETLEIYAQMAQSLGLWTVKKELEDLSFMYLEPELFEQIKQEVESDPRLDENFRVHMTSSLERLLEEKDIVGKVVTRINGYWGLYRKREAALIKGRTSTQRGFRDINDVVSFRIITQNLDDCYRVLGFIHQEFGEYVDFDRYDEFIGVNRRINGYSALQTTLDLAQGSVELAIATEEMEKFNRKGVVSLLEQGETNLEDYVLKAVFSSEGKVMFLPKKATGVDYAYAISQSLGANARSLVVDGVEKPIATVIPNASTVGVNTGEVRRAPDPDFLNYCLTATRAIIVDQLNLSETDKLVAIGRQKAEAILSLRGLLRFEDLGELANELVFNYAREDIRDIYLMLGRGSIHTQSIDQWLDNLNQTKQYLGITSIKLTGTDKAGILSDITKWISENGGNIKGIDLKTENGSFTLLMVADSLNIDAEQALRDNFESDNRFSSWKVV